MVVDLIYDRLFEHGSCAFGRRGATRQRAVPRSHLGYLTLLVITPSIADNHGVWCVRWIYFLHSHFWKLKDGSI